MLPKLALPQDLDLREFILERDVSFFICFEFNSLPPYCCACDAVCACVLYLIVADSSFGKARCLEARREGQSQAALLVVSFLFELTPMLTLLAHSPWFEFMNKLRSMFESLPSAGAAAVSNNFLIVDRVLIRLD